MDTNNNKISFWQRPEGTTGKIILGALFAAGAWAFIHYEVLTFLIGLATDTLHLMFLVGIIGAVAYTVMAERPRTLLRYILEMVSRQITSLAVDIDPVSILTTFVKDMKKKRETISDAITQMRGARAKIANMITQKDREMNEAIKMADAAQSRGDQMKLDFFTEKAGSREQQIENYKGQLANADETIETMTRVDEIIEFHINRSEDQLEQLRSDNEVALSMLAATKAAKGALGDSDMAEVRDLAVQAVRDRVAKATGEVESLMQNTKSLQSEMDYTKLAFRADGQKRLAELKAKINRVEAPDTVKQLTAGNPGTALPRNTSGINLASRINRKAQ